MTQIVAQTAAAALGAAAITTQISVATTAVIQALWRQVNPYDKQEVADFAAQAGSIIVSSQRTVANAHVAAQQLQLRAVGINQPVTVTIPDNVRGKTAKFGPNTVTVEQAPKKTVDYDDGGEQKISKAEANPEKLFERAAETYRYEKFTGSDDESANDAAEERISKLVDGNIMLAQRLAEQQTLSKVRAKDKRVIGYRRVIHPELSKGGVCGLCVAASDRKYNIEDLKPIHHRCNCGVAPITRNADPGHALNQDGLEQLYSDAGGTTAGQDLKKLRYDLVDHDELGTMLVRTKGDKVPYYNTANPPPKPKPVESKAEIAKRLLPGLEESLNKLRAQGLSEDSPQITYHLKQIDRLRGDLGS